MTSRDFCYWLQGYFELLTRGEAPPTPLTDRQTDLIYRHLALVFKHEIDPSIDKGAPTKKAALDAIHGPTGFAAKDCTDQSASKLKPTLDGNPPVYRC